MSEHEVALNDRGLAFGDGLFETLFVHRGTPVALAEHLTRLRVGLARLGLPQPAAQRVLGAIESAVGDEVATGVCKLIVTAGVGPRGYRRPDEPALTVRATFGPVPAIPTEPLSVDLSPVTLTGTSTLRGLKHLNRLEQVLAQQALPRGCGEGLMRDPVGRVVSGTMGNLFWRERGRWHTPALSDGAIAGTRRAWLIEALDARIIPCGVGRLALADAAFLSNAVSAWRPIGRLFGRELSAHALPADGLRRIEGCWQPPGGEDAVSWPVSLSVARSQTAWGRVARRDQS